MLDFLNHANADYIEAQYEKYRENPDLVEPLWAAFFAGLEAAGHTPKDVIPSKGVEGEDHYSFRFSEGVKDLVNKYRELGHYQARLNPLEAETREHPLLSIEELGFTEADLKRPVVSGGYLGPEAASLEELIQNLKATYCGTLGIEFMNISDPAQRRWLQEQIEPHLNHPPVSEERATWTLRELLKAEGFEQWLQKKYLGAKRFSVEGAESVIPLLNALVFRGAELGVEQAIMGCAHRGRLNILAHVLEKPYEQIFSEFEAMTAHEEVQGEGDVKYHLGYSVDRVSPTNHEVKVSLRANPSHLEMVDPVVEGVTRAKQYRHGDTERRKIVPILIHGEAAFCGQGIVTETLSLSQLDGYQTGGTIHVIINNQLGFTAEAHETRFTPYPTDLARGLSGPVFHVNADDPDACVRAAELAIEFRQKFGLDVFIDVWCYRRYGHNESDDPTYTQPLMYEKIHAQPTVTEIYSGTCKERDQHTAEDRERLEAEIQGRLKEAFDRTKENVPKPHVSKFGGLWQGMTNEETSDSESTCISTDVIAQISQKIDRVPDGFNLHRKLKKTVDQRREMAEGSRPVDWATAEAWAIGSLLKQGYSVRLAGQDSERGTFSHRHAVWKDVETGKKHVPLMEMADDNWFTVRNTMLSELAVVGFEYGYSIADPNNLVMWEAQFGDFVNGAQPILDLFLAAGESKWQRASGLVLLLPHGYEGMGPEHSSARLERFLQLCAGRNLQVVVPSLPHQYFHLLRRQLCRTFRKPLIVMTPKSLLRSKASTSSLGDFSDHGFQPVLVDRFANEDADVKRVLVCSGKVYFTLKEAIEKAERLDLVVARVEELYPFPEHDLVQLTSRFSHVKEWMWVQEEPHNQGAWSFFEPRFRNIQPDKTLHYRGRDESASPATGWLWLHKREEQEFVNAALRELSHE